MVQQALHHKTADLVGRAVADSLEASADNLKLALRRLGGGVSIITTGQGDQRTGATVTSATALSVDPPRMLVSLNSSSSTWPIVRQTGTFAVNLPGNEHEIVAQNFAGFGGLAGQDRYRDAEWGRLATGAPVLLDAAAVIDCEVEEVIERYSHVIVIGSVKAIRLGEGNSLIYQAGKFLHSV